MMTWNVQLFSITDALILLWIPSTNQITGNQHWRQRVCEIILTGNIVRLFGNCGKIAILSPELHIFTEV